MKDNYKIPRWGVLLALLLALSCNWAVAQNAITGTILDKTNGEPVIGATIMLDGTQRGCVTDIDGKFNFDVPNEGRLSVSYIGYLSQGIVLQKGKTSYDIVLEEDAVDLDEVVVVGYGTMRKKEVTGAVARVDIEEISKIATSDISMALQGQVAGVTVQHSGDSPGENSNVIIRGISSISGSTTPLYVVDGVPYDGDPRISENEIASIDILKDAASAAIYGTRGSGGVILITTKEGEKGKMRVSLDGYYGVQKITSTIDLLDAADRTYVDLLYDKRTNGTESYDRTWLSLKSYQQSFFNDTRLMDIVENDNAAIQNYSINLSGGSNDLTYSIVGGYFNQEGVIMNSSFERYNFRANTNFTRDKWNIGINVGYRLESQVTPGWGLMTESYKWNPRSTAVDPDASTTQNATGDDSTISNMGYILTRLKEDIQKNTDAFNSNFNVKYSIIKGLDISTRVGVNYSNAVKTTYNPLFQIYNTDGELKTTSTRSAVREDSERSTGFSWETTLNWTKTFGKHKINATGAYSMEVYTYESFYAKVYDLITTDVNSLSVGTSDMLVGTGTGQYGQDRENALIGMMGRVQYNYDERYLLSASLRRDGSSRFAEENRWGMFPSASAGWNISEEAFWSELKKTVSALKARASFGTTGNQNFSDYSYETVLSTYYDYAFGSNDTGGTIYSPGITQTSYYNSEVKWETTQQVNLGLDFAMFKNRLTGSFDVYKSFKKDMLFPLLVPASAGVGTSSTVTLNVGDMQNEGIELALGWRDKIKKFNYRVNATFSTNSNEVTSMSSSNKIFYFSDGSPTSGTDYVTVIAEGYAAGTFFVMPTNGIVNTEQKLAEYQQLEPNAQMGDLMYVDTNGDGVLDDDDRVDGGNGAPEYEIGLNFNFEYKNFDLSLNWYASLGNEVINGSKIYTYQNRSNQDLVYQWSEANPTSAIPAYGGSTHDNYRSYADIWVEDGSFLRLKNITLGYTLPRKITSKVGMSKLRVYVSADNSLTITGYSGYDPEVGNNSIARRGLDLGTYPVTMQFRGGVQITF
ncbi:MAG: TonB-dependent receptor [Rikenellaceae bacterium]